MSVGCHEQSNSSKSYPFGLRKNGILQIPIDAFTSYTSNNIQTFEEGGDTYLVIENENINGLQYYSVNTSKLVKQFKIPKEGLNSISEIRGFTVVNFDSVFVYDNFTLARTLLLNSDGEVKKKYYIRDLDSSVYFNHASMTRIPSIYYGSKLFFFKLPSYDFNKPDFFEKNILFEYEYDLLTEKSEYKQFSWPDSYNNHAWGFLHTIPSRVVDEYGRFLYSFGIEPHLHVNDFHGKYLTPKAESDFITQPIQPLGIDSSDPSASTKHFMEQGIYGMIIYDNYRKVYYRIAGVSTDYKDFNGNLIPTTMKPYTIVVLDTAFEKIGETKLEPIGDYYIKDWFVGSKGLYISINSPTNKDILEDAMQFQLFELIEN